jgi:hypothetical protein
MRNITIKDNDGIEIFEGDRLLFDNGPDGFLKDELIEEFKVDKMIGEVIPQDNNVGAKIGMKFFSGDKQVMTYGERKSFLLKSCDKEDVQLIEEYFNDKNLDDFEIHCVSSNEDITAFYQSFVHLKKSIISTLTIDKSTEIELNDLTVNVNNRSFPALTNFMVELSEESKKFVLERHSILYDNPLGHTGSFTHLKTSISEIDGHHYLLNFSPCNSDGECHWFSREIDNDKKYAEMEKIRKSFKENMKLFEKDKERTKEEISEKRKLNIITFKAKISEAETSGLIVKEVPVKDLFISISDHIYIMSMLENQGSTITAI